MNWIKSNYIVLGIIVILIFGILGTSYVALQDRKTAEQQARIIQEQAKNPKVIYKSAKEKTVYMDRIIEKKIYVGTNGTVITETRETIKDRIVEKEIIKEVKVPVYTVLDKDYTWILLGATYGIKNNDLGCKASLFTNNFLFQGSYFLSGNIEISVSYAIIKF